MPLLHGNLVDTCLVASTFEGRVEELLHDGCCRGGVDEASGHHEHVGIVVLAYEMRYFGYPAESGTYALMLVERHVDALAAAADGNAGVALAALHGCCKRVSIVGIVAAIGAVGAEVLVLPAFGLEPLLHIFFQFVTSVVAGKTYQFHKIKDYKLKIKTDGLCN